MPNALVDHPFLAVLPGLALLALGARSRSALARYTGMAWLVYAVYELGMKARVLCSGECNIRVDLLLIYPAFAALAAAAIVAALRARPGDSAAR